MVRVNLINPEKLADQHLIAEYDEILMLVAYIRKYPKVDGPSEYCLGTGHMKFFKDKLGYLRKRHDKLRLEMQKRGFVTNKKLRFTKGDWKPSEKDFEIIKKRIISKLKAKPGYYRYYGKKKSVKFFTSLISE